MEYPEMPLDFPNSPLVGQLFGGPGGISWAWDGTKWRSGPGEGAVIPPAAISISGASENTLPIGAAGLVLVNTVNVPGEIVVRLPASPIIGQELDIKDTSGFAAMQNVVVKCQDGAQIDDMYEYRIAYGFGGLGVHWTGTRWSIM
jgi:hypothetical protein